MPTLKIAEQDLGVVCDFVLESCGISLDGSKDYLIESRLSELCRELELESYASLVRKARTESGLQAQVIDAITTNETLFFRDDSPFQALQHKAIPELIDAKEGTLHPQRLRFWSAACSTGQEAYSMAMTLSEIIPDIHAWDIKILGSDVSPAAVEQASRGVYSPLEVERGLKADLLRKYFTQTAEGWRVCDKIRSLCSFEQRDLTKPLLGIGPFDIVFCRNVAIYFTNDDRKTLFERISRNMTPEGYLFIGSSECLSDIGMQPQHHCRSIFYRPGQP